MHLCIGKHLDPILHEKTPGPIYNRHIIFHDLGQDFLAASFVGLVHGGQP
jgi:hypothetical protein